MIDMIVIKFLKKSFGHVDSTEIDSIFFFGTTDMNGCQFGCSVQRAQSSDFKNIYPTYPTVMVVILNVYGIASSDQYQKYGFIIK